MIAGRVVAPAVEHRQLPGKADCRAGNQCCPGFDACAIDRVPRGEVVAAIENHIGVGDLRCQRFAGQAGEDRFDMDFRIDPGERCLAGKGLRLADALLGVQDLPLQIGQVHRIAVGQGDAAETCRGEIEGGR